MDLFAALVFGGIVVVLASLVGLGALSRRSVRDITHHGEHEALAARAEIEEREVPEMIEGQNRYRRRGGRSELTEREVRREVGARELERLDRADAEARSR